MYHVGITIPRGVTSTNNARLLALYPLVIIINVAIERPSSGTIGFRNNVLVLRTNGMERSRRQKKNSEKEEALQRHLFRSLRFTSGTVNHWPKNRSGERH